MKCFVRILVHNLKSSNKVITHRSRGNKSSKNHKRPFQEYLDPLSQFTKNEILLKKIPQLKYRSQVLVSDWSILGAVHTYTIALHSLASILGYSREVLWTHFIFIIFFFSLTKRSEVSLKQTNVIFWFFVSTWFVCYNVIRSF